MAQVNGKFFLNCAGNWQRFGTKTKPLQPAWSNHKGITKASMKKSPETHCEYCGEVKIPQAYHPAKKKIKFCSFMHGKFYMRKHPDTRYLNVKTSTRFN